MNEGGREREKLINDSAKEVGSDGTGNEPRREIVGLGR